MEEKTVYTPSMEKSVNPILLDNGFGWGTSFSNSVFSLLLGTILSPIGNPMSIYPTLPEVPEGTWSKFEEDTKDLSFEEKRPIMKKYFDPDGIMDKYFEKLKNPKEVAKLNAKLIKQDAKIAIINKKKQEIVDK